MVTALEQQDLFVPTLQIQQLHLKTFQSFLQSKPSSVRTVQLITFISQRSPLTPQAKVDHIFAAQKQPLVTVVQA